jgi:hypothetical protein
MFVSLFLRLWMKGRIEAYTTLKYNFIGLLSDCGGSSMEIRKHNSLIRLGRLNDTF